MQDARRRAAAVAGHLAPPTPVQEGGKCPFGFSSTEASLTSAQHVALVQSLGVQHVQSSIPGPTTENAYAYAAGNQAYLDKLHAEFGDVFKLPRGGKDVVFVRDAASVRSVVLSENFEKTWDADRASNSQVDYVMNLVQPMLTGTIFNVHGEENAARRKMLRPVVLYAEKFVDGLAHVLDEELAQWTQEKTVVDILDSVHTFVRKQIMVALAGPDPSFSYKYMDAFGEVLEYFVERYKLPEPAPEVNPKDLSMMQKLKDAGFAIVNDFRSLGRADKFERCILTLMFKNGSSDYEMAATVVNLVIAGAEAPSSIIAHTLEELAFNECVSAQLAEEIHRVCGDGRVEDHLPALPFLDGVAREGMRMFAPATLVQRQAVNDVMLNGRTITKGTVVGVCVTSVHNDERQFPNPHIFDPMRENNLYEQLQKNSCMMAFSSGPRGCPGRHIASNIIRLSLGKIIQRFEVSPAGPRSDHKGLVPKFVLWQAEGIPLTVSPRR